MNAIAISFIHKGDTKVSQSANTLVCAAASLQHTCRRIVVILYLLSLRIRKGRLTVDRLRGRQLIDRSAEEYSAQGISQLRCLWEPSCRVSHPMLRRLEDRIRDLCAKTVSAPEDELGPIISELKAALREHTQRLRKLAAAKLIRKNGPTPPDRSR